MAPIPIITNLIPVALDTNSNPTNSTMITARKTAKAAEKKIKLNF